MTGGILQLVSTGIDSIFLTSSPTITLFKTVYKRYTNFSLLNKLHKVDNCTEFNTKGVYKLKKEADCINKMYIEMDISDLKLEYPIATNTNVINLLNKYDIPTDSLLDYSNNYVYTPTDYDIIIRPIIENKLLDDVTKFNRIIYDISNNNYISQQDTNDYNTMVADDIYTSDGIYNYTGLKYNISNNYINFKKKVTTTRYTEVSQIIDKPYSDYIILSDTDISGYDTISFVLIQNKLEYKIYTQLIILRNIYLYREYYNSFNVILKQIDYFCKLDIWSLFESLYGTSDTSEKDNILKCIFGNLNEILKNSINIDILINKFLMNQNTTYNLQNTIHLIDNMINKFTEYYTLSLIDSKEMSIIYFNYITYFRNILIIMQNIDKYLINNIYLKIQRKIIIDYLFVITQILNKRVENKRISSTDQYNEIDYLNYIADNINYYTHLLYDEILSNYNFVISDVYSKEIFNYNLQNNKLITNYEIETKLFDILKRFWTDINNNTIYYNKNKPNTYYNNDILSYNEINDIFYNNCLLSLTRTYSSGYSIFGTIDSNDNAIPDINGSTIIDLSNNKLYYTSVPNNNQFTIQIINYLLDSLIKLFIIEEATYNNKKFNDLSGNKIGNEIIIGSYIGQTLLNYYQNKFLENQNNYLTILKNSIVDITTNIKYSQGIGEYLLNDTYLIMNKYLIENNKIISDESIFNDAFVNNFTSTLKINLLQNVYILIEIILHTLISNFYHDSIYYYNLGQKKQIDYFKLGYHKTFLNNVSTSNKISTLKGSTIKGLNDNITNLFNIYTNNDKIYPIYFARDILKNLTQFDINNFSAFENNNFIPYLNDINIWNKFLLNSDFTKNILQNLTFDSTGNVTNKTIYIDASGIAYDRAQNSTYFIDPTNNIYDKFIAVNSNNLFNKNLIVLNYIPLHVIRDVSTEIYNTLENNMSNGNLDLSANDLIKFDFRDFDEMESIFFGTGETDCSCNCIFEPTLSREEQYKILKFNQEFKMDLYKKILLNVILKQNNNLSQPVVTDYTDLIFNKNYYQIADLTYLTTYANNFLSDNQIGLISLMRPENLIDINIIPGIITLHNKQTSLYMPSTRAIIEIYRIKLYSIINSLMNTNKTFIKSTIDDILNNYIKFDTINNLNNPIYSYESFVNNGYQFTQSSSTNINNFTQQNYTYCHASSSIWSYINKHFISNYNSFLNNTLISSNYYKNTLGNFMGYLYDYIIQQLISYNENLYFKNTNNDYKKTLYSYDISCNGNITTQYLYDFNSITNANTFPVNNLGFDFYSLGNKYTFSNNTINIIQDFDFSLLSVTVKSTNIPNNNTNPFKNYSSEYTIIDFAKGLLENKLYYDVKLNYKDQKNIVVTDINNLVIPYYSNLLEIRNKQIPTELYTYDEYIDYLTYHIYPSDCEDRILEFAKEQTLRDKDNNNQLLITDILYNFIPQLLAYFNENENPFTTTDLPYISLTDVYDEYHPHYEDLSGYYFNTIIPYVNKNIFIEQNISQSFKNYSLISDIINYILTILIKLSDYKYLYDMLVEGVEEYKTNQKKYLETNREEYITNIILISKPINIDINANTSKILKYQIQESFIPFFDLFSLFPIYLNLDIMFRNSDLDVLLRNMINKTPVEYCWVPELGHYIFEYIDFYLDEYLIDSYNSNLQSLYNKLYTSSEHRRGYNIMIGNIEKYTKYDSTDKSKVKLIIPLRFYFCKSVPNSIPMINLLYTDATIRFKLRKLQDLLIYDTNAIIKRKPKLQCKFSSECIYLEQEERKKVAESRMEFLIERFRYGNIFYYNKSDFKNNKILTKIKLADPTKYILWRIKINQINTNVIQSPIDNSVDLLYDNTKKLTWNQNGFKDIDGNSIDIIKYIKINFNDSVREQGKPMLFSNINCYSRYIGSLETDEYLYSFSLYPMLEQPSGTANLSQIENLSVEHEFTQEFIDIMTTNGLQIEMEYWGLTYNIIRFISGMAAPLFYT